MSRWFIEASSGSRIVTIPALYLLPHALGVSPELPQLPALGRMLKLIGTAKGNRTPLIHVKGECPNR